MLCTEASVSFLAYLTGFHSKSMRLHDRKKERKIVIDEEQRGDAVFVSSLAAYQTLQWVQLLLLVSSGEPCQSDQTAAIKILRWNQRQMQLTFHAWSCLDLLEFHCELLPPWILTISRWYRMHSSFGIKAFVFFGLALSPTNYAGVRGLHRWR